MGATEVAEMAVVAGTAMAVACATPVATAVGVLLQASVALALLACLYLQDPKCVIKSGFLKIVDSQYKQW